MNYLQFLGTGSGAANMITQDVANSAIYFHLDKLKFILDPGPGTLVNAKKCKINLWDLNGVIVTHRHPDHTADVNCVLTAFKPGHGFLLGSLDSLTETNQGWPPVSRFHLSIPRLVKILKPEDHITIGDVSFTATNVHHYDVGIGLKIEHSNIDIGYVGDGCYFRDQENQFEGCKLLIFNVLVPYNYPKTFIQHMDVGGVIDFLNHMKKKPELVILQHYSEKMLKYGVNKQANIVENQTEVKTIAAKDRMKINLSNLVIFK